MNLRSHFTFFIFIIAFTAHAETRIPTDSVAFKAKGSKLSGDDIKDNKLLNEIASSLQLTRMVSRVKTVADNFKVFGFDSKEAAVEVARHMTGEAYQSFKIAKTLNGVLSEGAAGALTDVMSAISPSKSKKPSLWKWTKAAKVFMKCRDQAKKAGKIRQFAENPFVKASYFVLRGKIPDGGV